MTDNDRIDALVETCRRIEATVNQIDTKVDGHAEKLSAHEVRIAMLERTGQRQWERFALWVGVGAAIAAGWLPNLLH